MSTFTRWSFPTEIRFGLGASKSVGEALKQRGLERALIVTDPGVRGAGLVDPITESLSAVGIAAAIFDGLAGNPLERHVEDGLAAYHEAEADCLVAIGGAHDFMDWNRVRYALASDLEAAGHASESIDAGFDFGSWRHTTAALARGEQGGRVDRPDAPIAISFDAPKPERPIDERVLSPWLPGAPTRLFAYERDADAN